MHTARFFRLEALVALLIVIAAQTPAVSYAQAGAIDSYPTHPNFWPLVTSAGVYERVAKQYARSTTGASVWVWSGPLASGQRELHYCDASSTNPLICVDSDWVWERWQSAGNDRSSIVLQYGGATSRTALVVYPTEEACEAETNPGVVWPDLPAGAARAGPTLLWTEDNCELSGYIVVFRGQIGDKAAFCTASFRPNSVAWSLCRGETIDVVYQAYYRPIRDASGALQRHTGCEGIVYVTGNLEPAPTDAPASIAVRNWFRNGELKFSAYVTLLPPPAPSAPNFELWWRAQCAQTSSAAVASFVYTGAYKLESTLYHDTVADPQPYHIWLPTLWVEGTWPAQGRSRHRR